MRFELNEVDARRESYLSIIPFLNLVNALIAEERNISDKGHRYLLLTILSLCMILNTLKSKCSPSRFMGIFKFVYEDVFGPFPQRAYGDPREKWELALACLEHFRL
jgi:nuclear pore complex protein Nup205